MIEKIIKLMKKKKAAKLDKLYLKFLKDKAQGKIYISNSKELIKKLEHIIKSNNPA